MKYQISPRASGMLFDPISEKISKFDVIVCPLKRNTLLTGLLFPLPTLSRFQSNRSSDPKDSSDLTAYTTTLKSTEFQFPNLTLRPKKWNNVYGLRLQLNLVVRNTSRYLYLRSNLSYLQVQIQTLLELCRRFIDLIVPPSLSVYASARKRHFSISSPRSKAPSQCQSRSCLQIPALRHG